MGLFRRKDERAMPEPGSPEFEAMVEGSAIPDARSVSMGESGWASPDASQTIDLRGTETAEKLRETLRAHGIDLEKKGQTIGVSTVPGLYKTIAAILGDVIRQAPRAARSPDGRPGARKDPED